MGRCSIAIGTVFNHDRTQVVKLPAECRFPDEVKKVTVWIVGKDLVLSPVENSWDSFFLSSERLSEDFTVDRETEDQQEREPFC